MRPDQPFEQVLLSHGVVDVLGIAVEPIDPASELGRRVVAELEALAVDVEARRAREAADAVAASEPS